MGQQLLLGGYLDLSEVIAMPLPLGFDLDLLLLEDFSLLLYIIISRLVLATAFTF